MSKVIYTGLGALAAALLAPSAMATITLTAGSASYAVTQGTSATGTSGTANMIVGDGFASDQLFQDQWWWRVNGVSTREFLFFGGTEAGSGTSNGSISYANVGGMGFDAILNLSLTDTGNQSAMLVGTMVITNNSGSALNLSLFHYLDFDIGATAGSDSAVWVDQANNIMRITDGATTHFGEYQGIGANAYQVTTFSTLRTALGDTSITNLNNTGIPFGPGDFTGGFQWNLEIAAGATMTVTTIRTLNISVPAPGALALLGLAGLAGVRRRRN